MNNKDITELKAQINSLKKSLNESKVKYDAFETIFKQSTDGILLIENALFVDCNDAIVRMLGCTSQEQVLNLHPSKLSPEFQPDGQASFDKANLMMQTALDNGWHRFEWVHQRIDGSDFWVDVVLTKLTSVSNETIHVAWRDISIQKQLAQDIIHERNLATQANKAKSDFLANMSHELRTPMHGILSFANMGISKFDKINDEKKLKYFEHIKISGDRLMGLLNALLDLAKLESGKMEMSFAPYTLKLITDTCILEQQARLDELKLTIVKAESSIEGKCTFDIALIGQVITNFLSNAIKFTPKGSQLDINISDAEINSTGKVLPATLFSIRDQGTGIPQGEHELIFDKFVQSSDKTTHKGGTGLGLPICKEITDLHNGKIWAENHPDGGAVFSFIIPVEQPDIDVKEELS